MINGAHFVIYTVDADADREFFRDVLEFPSVDAGEGWLIFALPPAEIAFHPAEENGVHQMYFMCDDLQLTLSELEGRGVNYEEPIEAEWGIRTSIHLPSGSQVGLYQPKHPIASVDYSGQNSHL